MVVLFIGDIVGPEATEYVAAQVPELRRERGVDLVIANAENSAPSGLGMTVEMGDLLFRNGVDVITGGNHSWDSPESEAALMHPRVLRPHNLLDGVPGRGVVTLQAASKSVTVLNLADIRVFPAAVRDKAVAPYPCWLAAERNGTVIVDFHGDHVIEKQIFAYAVDGSAAAVIGTHTHEPTVPLYILPSGTALVTDVGMTGPLGGVQGFEPRNFVAGLLTKGDYFAPPLPGPILGPVALGAVLLEIEDGRTQWIERL